jgi:hypothetical protein
MEKFWEFLEKIKSYPEDTKNLIGLSVSGILTFVIVSMSFVLPGHAVKEVVAEKSVESNVPSPFTVLKEEFSQSFSKMRENMPFPSTSDLGSIFKAAVSQKNEFATSSVEMASSTKSDTAKNAATTTPTAAINIPKTKKKTVAPAKYGPFPVKILTMKNIVIVPDNATTTKKDIAPDNATTTGETSQSTTTQSVAPETNI